MAMDSSRLLRNGSRDTRLEKKESAIAAGFVYFAFLLVIGLLFEAAAQQWLMPRLGETTALAIGLALMLPLAWLTSGYITRCFAIASSWPLRAIVAATTGLLLLVVDVVFLALLDRVAVGTIVNHGGTEVRFAAQVFMSALPLMFRRR
jgi:hypothetical protein